MKVAILGTGKMGAAMAKRLAAAGHELHLWNRTLSRAKSLGVGAIDSDPESAIAAAEVVITALTGPSAVRDVYRRLPDDGERVYLEMSTAGPDIPEDLAGRFPNLIAAPIIAAPAAVAAGRALILVAGPPTAIARARPVLDSLGEHRDVGTRRKAAQLKLLNNAMLAATIAVAAELVTAGVKRGLGPDEGFEFMKRHAPYIETRKSGYLGGPYEPLTFRLRDMLKDVDLTLAEFDGPSFPMPIVAAIRDAYADVVDSHGEVEVTAVLERYRR